ncbi:histidine kinase dimerization/phospho-acceptor domain-containing protein [Novosphingobium sp. RD2P27]|uniref:histidine kinase n=1 Tax=Novosphingobium kalidii TaxID=3230299 RepID=A0ABV2D250_9SPHN
MEEVGPLTGGLAHDFNNLLAGVSGSLDLMDTRIAQGRLTEVDKYMAAAQGATKRTAALTHRLLAFSRCETLDPPDYRCKFTGKRDGGTHSENSGSEHRCRHQVRARPLVSSRRCKSA